VSNSNFHSLAKGLVDDAEEDDNGQCANSDTDTPPDTPSLITTLSGHPRRINCYFGRQELILPKLFQYSSEDMPPSSHRTQKGFDMFWYGAVANLQKELELYELMAEDKGSGTQGEHIIVD
jgi:hypothetical protein